jgi:hypothetical protein
MKLHVINILQIREIDSQKHEKSSFSLTKQLNCIIKIMQKSTKRTLRLFTFPKIFLCNNVRSQALQKLPYEKDLDIY